MTPPTQWDVEHLLYHENDTQLDSDMQAQEAAVATFVSTWNHSTKWLEDAAVLRQALDEYEILQATGVGGRPWYYRFVQSSLNQSDPDTQAAQNQADRWATQLETKLHFFELRLGKISARQQQEFLTAKKLAPYGHYLQRIFDSAQYMLSEAEEKILSLKSATSYEAWTRMTSAFLAQESREVLMEDGKTAIKGFSELLSQLASPVKAARASAYDAVNTILQSHEAVAEREVNAILADKQVSDELRGFTRPDAARHLADDISSDVVDTMITTVTSNAALAHRHYALKARLLGVKKLAYYERSVPVVCTNQKIEYPQAAKLVKTVFAKLHPHFAQIFQRLQNGHIDVYPAVGKRGGAWCSYPAKTLPTLIMLNHANQLTDTLTLAHEMGHAINAELIKAEQNALNFGTLLSTAEVASTFMEDFVLQELLTEANDEQRLALLVQRLDSDIATVFRQAACYTFEQTLHAAFRAKGYLAKEEIGELFATAMTEYMGPSVEQPTEARRWWIHWHHIRSYFYVYSYSSGLLIAKALQAKYKADPAYISNIMQFLSAGTSDSPQAMFASHGIAIDRPYFWQTGIDQIAASLAEAEALATKLGK